MTKVLVTGGSGLVGRNLCKRLQEKGYVGGSIFLIMGILLIISFCGQTKEKSL